MGVPVVLHLSNMCSGPRTARSPKKPCNAKESLTVRRVHDRTKRSQLACLCRFCKGIATFTVDTVRMRRAIAQKGRNDSRHALGTSLLGQARRYAPSTLISPRQSKTSTPSINKQHPLRSQRAADPRWDGQCAQSTSPGQAREGDGQGAPLQKDLADEGCRVLGLFYWAVVTNTKKLTGSTETALRCT